MRFICLGFLSLIFPVLAWGQVYNLSSYTPKEGLIQSQVKSILQDQQGFLWFGTHRGISRFDGSRFTNYGTKDGLRGNFVTDLHQDTSGTIWMATNRGLCVYDYRGFRLPSEKFSKFGHRMTSICEDRQGRMWLGTENKGLFIYDPKVDSLIENPYFPDSVAKDLSILTLVSEPNGTVWLGTNKGLWSYRSGRIEYFALPVNNLPVFSVLRDSNRTLWIGTSEGAWQYAGGSFQQFDVQTGLPNKLVKCMLEDNEGKIWFGTDNGVAYYDLRHLQVVQDKPYALSFRISSALLDHEGNIWMGTDGGGVRKIVKGIFQNYDVSRGMRSNIAKSFLEDSRGRIWISTYDRGLSCLAGDRFVAHYTVRNGLGGNDLSYSFEDRKGNFWFASYNGGLTRFDGTQFNVFTTKDGLSSNRVFCLSEDSLGNLWIGTNQGICIRERSGKISPFSHNEELLDKAIYSIFPDSQGRIWIGSPSGVSVWTEGKIRNFDENNDFGRRVLSILEDYEGRIWFSSSSGLYAYVDGEFEHVPISEASGANSVVSTVMGTDSTLWLGTENGAYRLDLKQFSFPDPGEKTRFEHYTRKDGLPILECNANAAFCDSKGNIWLGTVEGAIMRPEGTEREDTQSKPRILITAIRGGHNKSWDELGFPIHPATGLPEQPKLPRNEDLVEIEYMGISLKSPRQVEYRYKLEGLDWEWSRPTRQNNVSYANLKAGNYTFRVVAKKESSSWDYDNEASFSFYIQPAYWERTWFRSLVVLLLAGLIWVGYNRATHERKRRQKERQIQDQAEKLRLEHQALYAMMNPHFTFNALQSIQYFIHRQDKKAANKFLSSFAKLVRKNLESTKSEYISLHEEVERLKLYLSLEQMRFPEKFDYEFEIDPDLDMYHTQLPPMVLQPFVENSIKHGIMPMGEGGLIRVSIETEGEDYLMIRIQDNGIGIERSKELKANRPNSHVSKGMQITQDRMALFGRMTNKNYSIDLEEIKSELGEVEGTVVKMKLPLHLIV